MNLKKNLITLSIAALGVTAIPEAKQMRGGGASQLDLNEQETLLFMREEEKLARDVYLTLYEQWEKPVFASIAESEERHTAAVAGKIDKYGLNDPVLDDSIGIFVNTDLLEKYYELVTKGMNSELDALMVGAYIEELDMIDLQDAIEETDQRDLDRLYGNLLRGSRNHLRAFVARIEELTGEIYKSQLLDQDAVDAILSESVETGGS